MDAFDPIRALFNSTKRHIVSLLFLALSTVNAIAQVVEFEGKACLTHVTNACNQEGWAVGNCAIMQFRPADIGANGSTSQFTFRWATFVDNYEILSNSLVGAKFLHVNEIAKGRGAHSSQLPTVRVAALFPSTPTLNTQSITVVGDINAFGAVKGCDVSFAATIDIMP